MTNVHNFKIEDKIKETDTFTDDEKEALLNQIRHGVAEAYTPELIKDMMSRFEKADDREPTAKISDVVRLEGQISSVAKDVQWIKFIGSAIIVVEVLPWLSGIINFG